MKKILFGLLLTLSASLFVNAEVILYGQNAAGKFKGAELVRYKDNATTPSFIRFSANQGPLVEEFASWLSNNFELDNNFTLADEKSEEDNLGYTHIRYVQYYQSAKVEFASIIAHVKNGRVESFGGYTANKAPQQSHALDESSSLQMALNHVGANKYKWQDPAEETHLKWESGNSEATYFPEGEMVYFPENLDFNKSTLLPCWKFDVYAQSPLYRAYVYVDAVSGSVVFEDQRIKDIDTLNTANTSYSGIQTITTDYFANGLFRLRETGRGNGVQTFDMVNGTSHGGAVDITNDSIYWHDTLRAEYATDAHWGAEKVYDYYFSVHNRNSIDGNGLTLRSYVHYSNNYANAFWDGQRMTYGDGNSNISALTTLDIAGHEITHGVDQYTSDLIYSYESGALDESFADIFGNAVEAHYKPDPIKNWLVGEEIGSTLRSMSNPKSRLDPDTYLGTYWYTGTGDNGGVHTNSGVQNFWFYLLSVGGSGTNDNSDVYSVTGLGIAKAEQIAYRNRAYHLTSTSDYEDARFYSIQSAYEIYGPCTPELESTVDAWHAVGIGDPYSPTVVSDFEAGLTEICFLPAQVNFKNLSNYNSVSYSWDFGDGTTDTSKNPVHIYNAAGNYTVKLTATGNSMCGSDVETKNAYIKVTPPVDAQASPYGICEGYAAKIQANVNDVAFWYADSNASTPIFVGNPFISPPLFKDTSYYLANGQLATLQSVGPVDNTIGGGANFSGYRYLNFDVYEELTLSTVKVISYANSSRTIELRDANSNVLQSKTVTVATGPQTITLDFKIIPGTDYQLGVNFATTADFFRNNTGANYPYEIPGLLSITKPGNAPPSYYYFFYDWKVKGKDCVGRKFEVPVTVDFDPGCVPYVGIDESDESLTLNVYPNPSDGIFNVELDMKKSSSVSINIIDSKGQLVYQELKNNMAAGRQLLELNAGNLSSGFYMLQVIGDNMNESRRIVIR